MLENYLLNGFIDQKKYDLLNKIIGYKYVLVVTNDEATRNLLNNAILNLFEKQGYSVFLLQNSDNVVNHTHSTIQKYNVQVIQYYQQTLPYDQLICYLMSNDAEYAIDIINYLHKYHGAIINIEAANPIAGLEKIYRMVLFPRQYPASAGSEFLIKTLICQCFHYIVCLTDSSLTIYERNATEFSPGAAFDTCFIEIP